MGWSQSPILASSFFVRLTSRFGFCYEKSRKRRNYEIAHKKTQNLKQEEITHNLKNWEVKID